MKKVKHETSMTGKYAIFPVNKYMFRRFGRCNAFSSITLYLGIL